MLSDAPPIIDGPALVLAVLLALLAGVAVPILGSYDDRRLRRAGADGGGTLEQIYWGSIATQLLLGLLVVFVAALGSGVTLAHLGVRAPTGYGPVAAAAIAYLAVLAGLTIMQRRRGRPVDVELGGGDAVARLLPKTKRERRVAVLVAVTVGIGEELLYRGLLIALGLSLGLPLYAAVAASCVIFAIGHLYQGWRGALSVGVFGVFLGLIYAATGSLLLPVLIHIALDLREMVLTPRGRRHAPT